MSSTSIPGADRATMTGAGPARDGGRLGRLFRCIRDRHGPEGRLGLCRRRPFPLPAEQPPRGDPISPTPATATVERRARRGWLLVSELRAPVPEALRGQPVRRAIFPLIQIAPPPTVRTRPPERCQFRALPGRHSWHDPPPPSQNLPWREDRTRSAGTKRATPGRLPQIPCSAHKIPCYVV